MKKFPFSAETSVYNGVENTNQFKYNYFYNLMLDVLSKWYSDRYDVYPSDSAMKNVFAATAMETYGPIELYFI